MTEQYAELRSRLVVGRKSDGRGVYDEAAKKELIVACLKQGVSVARMAMEHGVNTNLLRTWITTYQRRSAQVPTGGIAQTQDVECFPYPRTPSHPWFKEYFARLNSRGERYFSAL
ncbi:transposase, partial [Variovorax paradoxus]|uniref:transposase n=1 Tax=Variovorax paradoxus TaxID=34073 RepID=UPI00155DE6FF